MRKDNLHIGDIVLVKADLEESFYDGNGNKILKINSNSGFGGGYDSLVYFELVTLPDPNNNVVLYPACVVDIDIDRIKISALNSKSYPLSWQHIDNENIDNNIIFNYSNITEQIKKDKKICEYAPCEDAEEDEVDLFEIKDKYFMITVDNIADVKELVAIGLNNHYLVESKFIKESITKKYYHVYFTKEED